MRTDPAFVGDLPRAAAGVQVKAAIFVVAGLLATPLAHAAADVSNPGPSPTRTSFGLAGGLTPLLRLPFRWPRGVADDHRTPRPRRRARCVPPRRHDRVVPRYACDECLVSGFSAQGLAEVGASLLGPLGVFARGSLGVALVGRTRRQQADASRLEPAAKLMAGPGSPVRAGAGAAVCWRARCWGRTCPLPSAWESRRADLRVTAPGAGASSGERSPCRRQPTRASHVRAGTTGAPSSASPSSAAPRTIAEPVARRRRRARIPGGWARGPGAS